MIIRAAKSTIEVGNRRSFEQGYIKKGLLVRVDLKELDVQKYDPKIFTETIIAPDTTAESVVCA